MHFNDIVFTTTVFVIFIVARSSYKNYKNTEYIKKIILKYEIIYISYNSCTF